MKVALVISGLLLISFTGISQTYRAAVRSVDGAGWGYVDEKGNISIQPKFALCDDFSADGWAAVEDPKEFSHYFINKDGARMALPPLGKITSIAGKFNSGLMAIKVGGDWGFLNTNGKLQIPLKYDDVTAFDDGYAVVRRDKKYFVLNTNGEETVIEISKLDDVKHFSEGLAPFRAGNRMGFIDQHGKIAIEAKFTGEGYFSDGAAWARTAQDVIGFIDRRGEWILPAKYDAAHDFDPESHIAQIKVASRWDYVDKGGKMLRVPGVDVWKEFHDGLAAGRQDGLLWGFYDNSGQWVIKPQFDGIREFKNGYCAARLNGKWGFINKKGEWVISPIFGAAREMERVD